jgi:hypothetical protein
LFGQLLSLTMAGEQTNTTAGENEERLRLAALASQSEAAAAAATAPASGAEPSIPGMPPGLNRATLQAMLQTAVSSITSSLTEKVQFLTERDERRERQTTTMKAAAARLETQRARANDIGKSDGKSATLARQLDFAENQLAQMDTCRDMLLGLVLDKPAPLCQSAGPISPSSSVCGIKDLPDGLAALNELEAVIAAQRTKLKELIIVWNAPSYRVAYDAIRGEAFDGAEGEAANQALADAIARDEKSHKRAKAATGWGDASAGQKMSKSGGGWGSGNADQSGGGWGSDRGGRGNGSRGGDSQGGWGGQYQSAQPLPPSGPPPASFGGDSAPWAQHRPPRGPPAKDECAYCRKKGHYKDTCPLLAAQRQAQRGW